MKTFLITVVTLHGIGVIVWLIYWCVMLFDGLEDIKDWGKQDRIGIKGRERALLAMKMLKMAPVWPVAAGIALHKYVNSSLEYLKEKE